MNFHSPIFFFLFLPITAGCYFFLGRFARGAWPKVWLLAVSLAFFAVGGVANIPLLLSSIAFNCLAASLLLKEPSPRVSRKTILIGAISANVAFLCYFKYTGFFVENFNQLVHTAIPLPHSALPLGISFYTIYQIMFLVDCYEGLVEDHSWLDHFVFASFFPYVTMGPIVRWKQVVPQLNSHSAARANADNIARGVFIFIIGLFKKVVLADSFYRWADAGFSYHQTLSLGGAWITALSYTFQMYFDFSGYTDMAIGVALMLNVQLPQNFNAPFRALSIIDYWRRWHMTLTSFITTYLYTPMVRGMKRVTFAKAMVATLVAMLIAGLWHGANWTFVVFGAIHGVGLVINHCWKKMKWPIPDFLAWAATFTCVVVALAVFRADNVREGWQVIASMFSVRGGMFSYVPWGGIDRVDQVTGIAWMLFGIGIVARAPSSMQLEERFKPSWATVALTVGLAVIAFIYANGVVSRSFLYRDF